MGSGEHPVPDYVHLDTRVSVPSVDVRCDITRGIPLPPACADEILANHLLEHISWRKTAFVLREIRRVLVPGGRLLFRTPDLAAVLADYQRGMVFPELLQDEACCRDMFGAVTPFCSLILRLYSSQDHPDNIHRVVFDFPHINRLLTETGFTQVCKVKGLAHVSASEMIVECHAPGNRPPVAAFRESFPWWTWCVARLAAVRTAGRDAARICRNFLLAMAGVFLLRSARKGGGRTMPRNPRSVVVFNLAGVGDFCRMAPFLKLLKSRFPGIRVTLICNSGIRDVSLWRDWWDEVFFVKPVDDFCTRFSDAGASPESVYRYAAPLVWRLRRRRYDTGWVFGFNEATGNFGSSLFALSGVRFVVGVHPGRLACLNDAMAPVSRDDSPYEVYARAATVAGLGAMSFGSEDTAFRVPGDLRRWAIRYLAAHGVSTSPRIILHPGSGGPVLSRRWPSENYARLGDRIMQAIGVPVILTGGPAETGLVRATAELMQGEPLIAAGFTTLKQFAALLAVADVVVTNDTSALHLALAAGKSQVVALFGPTDSRKVVGDAARLHPICGTISCSPCARLDGNDPGVRCTQPGYQRCLETIPVDRVFAEVAACLNNNSSAQEVS